MCLHIEEHYIECTYVHECGVDVVGALSVDGDEEREAAVRRQHVHAPVLLMVPRQQSDAAVLHAQRRSHHVQRLEGEHTFNTPVALTPLTHL